MASIFYDELMTVNGTGSGVGLPQQPTSIMESTALTTWLTNNKTAGAQTKTKTELYREFIPGPEFESETGIKLTPGNYVNYAKAESQRLFNLGYTMVHEPDVARVIFESYRRAAGNPGQTYFPVSEDSAQLLTDATKQYQYQYIVGNIIDDAATAVPKVVRKVGDKLEDLGEVITNPLTLPAIAVIAVVGVLVAYKLG